MAQWTDPALPLEIQLFSALVHDGANGVISLVDTAELLSYSKIFLFFVFLLL